jgi:carbon monoxide dehydrogenase subunit G
VRTRHAITVPISPEQVWSFVTDWERQAEWMADADRVEVESARREGVGVRLRVRTRLFGIPAFAEPMEVIGWQPPTELTIRHGGPVKGIGKWHLEPAEGGTQFTWTEEVELGLPVVGAFAARCYAPVLSRLMRRSMRDLARSLDGGDL